MAELMTNIGKCVFWVLSVLLMTCQVNSLYGSDFTSSVCTSGEFYHSVHIKRFGLWYVTYEIHKFPG